MKRHRVCSRLRDGWVLIYVAPFPSREDPESCGIEVARIHPRLVQDHPDGKAWLDDILRQVGRSSSVGIFGVEPERFDSLTLEGQEPQA